MLSFMLKTQEGLRRLVALEDGQDLIEYAMIISMVTLALIASLHGIAGSIANAFTNISSSIT